MRVTVVRVLLPLGLNRLLALMGVARVLRSESGRDYGQTSGSVQEGSWRRVGWMASTRKHRLSSTFDESHMNLHWPFEHSSAGLQTRSSHQVTSLQSRVRNIKEDRMLDTMNEVREDFE